ncbi:uncharacterized protein F4807DRAFT_467976 [Annulohypoxylon truncatum]|uniref:uncharacterized protein n=1 Tax=Annulohypoxylon truncatum TaxID=327061 RepID=UPI0020081BDC|nr:uncharacterized protein F4807DRAFT_467976 [Annulohypoxylon truncatum]KAI1209029.1 hypothetical protein F4807DRAFT_467976 [Annulohypoxylon truncatum]
MDPQEIPLDDVNSRPDEYARTNGLSVDSQGDVSLLFNHVQGTRLLSDEQTDDTALPQLRIPYLVSRTEQLSVSKESLELLSTITSLERQSEQDLKIPTLRDITKLKLEPPLLRSDPDFDFRELARCVQEQRRADIDLTSVPSEPLDTSNDESLEFPDTAYQYKQKLLAGIQDEKLDISRESLHYLTSVLKDEWTQDKQEELEDTFLHRKCFQELAITPPLSPHDHQEDYFVPSEEVCQIPIPSDTSTLLEDDLRKAEADLLRQDDCDLDTPAPLESLLPSSPGGLPLLEPKRPSINSLKVEGPLTPLNSLPPSSELAVDISGFAKSLDIDQVLDNQQLGQASGANKTIPHKIFSDDTLALLEDKAASARRIIDQEQLQSADAIARIEIPTMDFSIPDPEWKKAPLDASSQLAYIKKTCKAFNIPPWSKNFQAERELKWSPFTSKMGHISLNESIDGDDGVGNLLDCPSTNRIVTSADYVWKKPGLAILREPEEEEEQLESSSEGGDDRNIESLVRKRKRKLETINLDLEPSNSAGSASPIDLVQNTQRAASGSAQLPNLLLSHNDSSATSTLLSNHINFHASKRQKNTKSSFFPTLAKPVTTVEEKRDLGVATAVELKAKNAAKPDLKPKPGVPAPCPKYRPTSASTKIIKALTLDRGVFSRLEKFYPNAEIIERDFDRWNTLAWDRNSVSRSPIVSPLAAEADVIVSPTTGIVVTTLLKAMQKPSPGHKGLAAIRERIRNVACRYERLIVLVSEGNQIDETARNLTPFECAAYADFSGFVVGQDTNAQVYYVGGGTCTLTKWLVSFLTCYAPEAAGAKDLLIQEETLWELFLRRAGMNAYAAQAILGQLKAPDDIGEEEAGKYGLPAFIRMTPAERVQNFRVIMGGERVLRRVSQVLETQWSSLNR